MDQRQFNYLIRRLENDAHLDERGYRRRVLGLSLLGYLYVFGSIALAALAAAGAAWYVYRHPGYAVVAWYVVPPMIVLLFLILRALWVRFDPPLGRRVTRAQTPQLFEMIDKVRAKLEGPPIHEVLISDEFNASIVQNPRLGMLGWYRNYLVLGLPYLMVLEPRHVAAVVAHEYGHLSGAHGKFASWIYRQRAMWGQLIHRLQRERHWATSWFTAFLGWYAPYFYAYSFVLARANEYEADRASADVVGREAAAAALVAAYLKARFYYSEFWSRFWAGADSMPTPARSPYASLRTAFRAGAHDYWASAEWLRRAMGEYTDTEDTHPALRDRLESLGVAPQPPAPEEEGGADRLLGPLARDMVAGLDEEWRREHLPAWRERHEYVQRASATLRELRGQDVTRLAVPKLLELAALEEEFGGSEQAIGLYKRVLNSAPEHVAANYELGRLLLRSSDESGLAALDIVLRMDDAYASAVADLAYPFLAARGRKQEAERYLTKLEERQEIEAAALDERGALEPDAPITLHDLEYPDVREIVRTLRQFPGVKRAWLVRRAENYRILPHWQAYVLIISRGMGKLGSGWGVADDVWEAVDVPGMLSVVPDEDGYEALRARADALLGARIYG